MTFDRFSRLASIPALALAALCFVAVHSATAVKAASISLLRDPDIERSLTEIAAPVLRAAGLNSKRLRVLVVNDSSFNAFVIDSRTIFIHYGLILKLDRPDMLQAVIAHEAAHITNGHIARRMQNMRSARSVAGFGAALAVLAAAAGAGEAAAGLAIGTQSSALRGFLAHTRAEESSADRSAAAIMQRAGLSPQGLVDLHRIFEGQELLNSANQDPYMRSHPLTRDRIRAAEAYVAAHGAGSGADTSDANTRYWFARLHGKLSAFTRAPKWTLRRVAEESFDDVRHMREAIAHHRRNDLSKALRAIDEALAIRPSDPYYQELKGQILIENRRWQAALSAYGQARSNAPENPLILASLGRAQLAAKQPKAALRSLEASRRVDFRNSNMLRDLAQAYAQAGQNGMAALATAERYSLQGRLKDAGVHAKRATRLLATGSPAWRRAEDVLIAAEQDAKRKRK